VSKLEFFQRTKLDYRDVCDPSLLIKNPERYFGWAALNISKYRAARPHAGYDLLRRWRDDLYPAQQQQQQHGADELVRTLHAKLRDPTSIRSLEGLGVSALPGRTFVFTTNVDGFFLRAGFQPEEVQPNTRTHTHNTASLRSVFVSPPSTTRVSVDTGVSSSRHL
jgi:NAD-dependent SIR2 family protein deacetylase